MTSRDAIHLSAAELISSLGDWSSRRGPLYVALAMTLEDLILRGDIAPGAKLPPERAMARSLSLSRGTVMNAYELLRDRALVSSRQGSGTHVRVDAARPLLPDMDSAGQSAPSRALFARLFDQHSDVIDLAVAVLHDTSPLRDDLLPASWKELEGATAGHGYSPQGLPGLREEICGYYQDRGLRTDPLQITVTSGAQQGLDLAAALALRPGDRVLVESPTYPGAIDTFARHGARIETFPFDSHWDRPKAIHEAVERFAPRLVYLMPGLHNPVARTLPDGRRREIARLADEHQLYVVEDNTVADVVFAPREQATLAAYSKHERVLTLGSLSKSAWGGLRVGWIRADAGLTARMSRIKAARDLGLSPIAQLAAQQVLSDLDTTLTHRRTQLACRAQVLQSELTAALPTWRWVPPEGGLSLWVQLPTPDADDFVQLAMRHGVAVLAGSAHCLDDAGVDRVRIAFSPAEPVLVEGVRRLKSAWDAFTGSTSVHELPDRPEVVELASRRRNAFGS